MDVEADDKTSEYLLYLDYLLEQYQEIKRGFKVKLVGCEQMYITTILAEMDIIAQEIAERKRKLEEK